MTEWIHDRAKLILEKLSQFTKCLLNALCLDRDPGRVLVPEDPHGVHPEHLQDHHRLPGLDLWDLSFSAGLRRSVAFPGAGCLAECNT